jgi:hypothetical protein
MKKTLLMMAIGFGIASVAVAQDGDGFQIGAKAGFTSTQYTTDDIKSGDISAPDWSVAKEDAKGGYLLGGYMRMKLIGNLSLQPEFYYAKKTGTSQYKSTDDQTINQDLTMYTWNIPVLAHLAIIDLNKVNVYGITGPVWTFNANNDNSASFKEDMKKGSWAYQLGAGVDLWRWNFDVRYEWGLSNVSDGAKGLDDYQFDKKSDMLTFAVGYRLF